MPDSFQKFFANDPFWAIIIMILMVMPILGAIAWVVLRAIKKPSDNKEDHNNFPR
jgi:hypothetical protein